MKNKVAGHLRVGYDDRGYVLVDSPEGLACPVGFSPDQARHLANLLYKKAAQVEQSRRSVSVFLIDRKQRVLLGRRLTSYSGTYAAPGGKVDLGETILQAAFREVREETGLVVRRLHEFGTPKTFPSTDNGERTQHWVWGFVSGVPQNTEPDKCEGWRFYPLDELPKPLIIGTARALVRLRGLLK